MMTQRFTLKVLLALILTFVIVFTSQSSSFALGGNRSANFLFDNETEASGGITVISGDTSADPNSSADITLTPDSTSESSLTADLITPQITPELFSTSVENYDDYSDRQVKAPIDDNEARSLLKEAASKKYITTFNCTLASQMQSSHPYGNNLEVMYVYRNASAAKISITFSSDTYLEENYDFIGIFDAQSTESIAYTGGELAGKTITVSGNVIKILFLTDSSITHYGFRVTKITSYTKPSVPTPTASSSSSVNLSWNSAARIAGYHVYRSDTPNGTYGYIGQTTNNSFSSNVPVGRISYFKIRGYSLINGIKYLSGFSNYSSIYPLAKPILRSVSVASPTELNVAWNAVPNASSYQVYHSTSIDGTYSLISNTIYTTKSIQLSNSQNHYFKVRAVIKINNANYYSSFSDIMSGAFQLSTVATVSTSILSATATQLSWSRISGASGYQVYRSSNPSSGYYKLCDTNALTYKDSSIQKGSIVYYKVRAFAGSLPNRIYGSFSTVASTLGLGGTPITSIVNTGSSIDIGWNSVDFATKYNVYRSETENGGYTLISTVSGTSYSDTNVTRSYYYKVRTLATANNGSTYLGPTSLAKRVNPTYRALLIGNTYVGTNYELKGPSNDAAGVSQMMNRYASSVSSTRKTNLTSAQILSQIQTSLGSARFTDISIFYFSGHGAPGGLLIGSDGSSYVSPTQLKSVLDTVKGVKIVIIDACNSGAQIGKSSATYTDQDFLNDFISAFDKGTKNLAAENYYVITSAHSSQNCREGTINNKWVGYFTYAFCKGGGYDYALSSNTNYPADVNRDRRLTLTELYNYAYRVAIGLNSNQAAQVYPTNSNFVLFGY